MYECTRTRIRTYSHTHIKGHPWYNKKNISREIFTAPSKTPQSSFKHALTHTHKLPLSLPLSHTHPALPTSHPPIHLPPPPHTHTLSHTLPLPPHTGYHTANIVTLAGHHSLLVWGGLHNRAPTTKLEIFDLETNVWRAGMYGFILKITAHYL